MNITSWPALALALICICTPASAADLHLTPAGSGNKDGSSWDNALDQTALAAAVNERLAPGDRLLLEGGTYQDVSLTVKAGGLPKKPKQIVGVDRGGGLPVFSSSWSVDRPDKGPVAIRLEGGVSDLTIEHLRVRGYMMGIHAAPAKDASGSRARLVFQDVDMEQFRYGFYLSDCDEVLLADCDLKRYSKHGFRFEQGCDDVTVRHCTADCSEGDADWELKTESLPFGFSINDGGAPNTKCRFQDCIARNNMKPVQNSRYLNGDGFVVEGNSSDVVFTGCRAIRNQDGGFDLKVPDVQLTDCVAVANKRGFRIWKTGTLTNCFAGWGPTGLWCNGGPLLATRCTFLAAQATAVMTDDRTTAPVTLRDCILSLSADAPKARTTLGKVVMEESVVADAAAAVPDSVFKETDASLQALSQAMNSRAFPEKGYRSAKGAER